MELCIAFLWQDFGNGEGDGGVAIRVAYVRRC